MNVTLRTSRKPLTSWKDQFSLPTFRSFPKISEPDLYSLHIQGCHFIWIAAFPSLIAASSSTSQFLYELFVTEHGDQYSCDIHQKIKALKIYTTCMLYIST